MNPGIAYRPLTKETWPALEKLFGAKGACGGCWCMYWRLTASAFNEQKGETNRRAFQQIVEQGFSTGVLAFDKETAVGWCAIAPREQLKRFETSRVLKPVDDKPVWSVHCFFMKKEYRNKGLSVPLLKAAIDYATSKGAALIEGYPIELLKGKTPDVFVWTGLAQTFLRAGFKEVARRSETRPIMRLPGKND